MLSCLYFHEDALLQTRREQQSASISHLPQFESILDDSQMNGPTGLAHCERCQVKEGKGRKLSNGQAPNCISFAGATI